jgi:exosortase
VSSSFRLWPLSAAVMVEVGLIAGLLAALYSKVLYDLAYTWWTDPSASHGLLIPPLAVYVAWLQRRALMAEPAVPTSKGLWVTAFGCAVFLVGELGAEFFLTRLSLVIILAGLIVTFWGAARLRKLAFPMLLLVTMIPLPALVWNALATPLQLFASDTAANLAQSLGVAVYRDGNIIHLAGLSLGVAEACSGLHSLSALTIAALVLGFLKCSSIWTRIVLVVLAIPLAVAVNVVRVTGTAVLADHWEAIAYGFYHSFSGWLVFLMGFGALWLITGALHHFEKGV